MSIKILCQTTAIIATVISCPKTALAQENTVETTNVEHTLENNNTTGMAAINAALTDLSQDLLLTLPKSGTYAIRSATDTNTGVPDEIFNQLSSSLQSSLMVASDFEISLIDQGKQELSWSNAIEFNGADFEELIKNSNFTAVIILNTRATVSGLELSLQAVGATEQNAGSVLASTPVKSVQLDWTSLAGKDLSDKTSKKIEEIQSQLEALKAISEPVQSPSSFAEFIHNARIHKSRNEIDNVIMNLENAIKIEPQFVDVISEFTELLIIKYGADNAKMYLKKRLEEYLSREIFMIANLTIEPSSDIIQIDDFVNQKVDFPPLAAKWLWGQGQQELDLRQRTTRPYQIDYALLSAARVVMRAYKSGQFQQFFLDPLKAADFARFDDAKALEKRLNRAEYSLFSTKYRRGTGSAYFHWPQTCRISGPSWGQINSDFKAALEEECGLLPPQIEEWQIPSGMTYEDVIASQAISTGLTGGRTGEVITASSTERINLNEIFYNDSASGDEVNEKVIKPCASVTDMGLQSTPAEIDMAVNSLESYLPAQRNFDEFNSAALKAGATAVPLSDVHYPSPATDRLSFADFCLAPEQVSGDIIGISELLITDDVDQTKPVKVTVVFPNQSDEVSTLTADITRDGTIFAEGGVPVYADSIEGDVYIPLDSHNNWLFAPGIVQILVGRTAIQSVEYTDIYGEVKNLDVSEGNIFVHAPQDFVEKNLTVIVNESGRWPSPVVLDDGLIPREDYQTNITWSRENFGLGFGVDWQSPTIYDTQNTSPFYEQSGVIDAKTMQQQEINTQTAIADAEEPGVGVDDRLARLRKNITLSPTAEPSNRSKEEAQMVILALNRAHSIQDRQMLQEILSRWGLYEGAIDGDLGQNTQLALEAFFDIVHLTEVTYSIATPDDFVNLVNKMMQQEYSEFFTTEINPSDPLGFEGTYDVWECPSTAQGSGLTSDTQRVITTSTIEFYEASCEIISVSVGPDETKNLAIDCMGEESTWTETLSILKDARGDLQVTVDGSTEVWKACQ